MPTRYDIEHLAEAQFEAGSRGRVLRNSLGIRRKREMDALEALKLAEATDYAIRHISAEHRFAAQDICALHRQWLGKVYPWAGEYRRVNISKGGFTFAMAAQVPRLMDDWRVPCWRFIRPANSRSWTRSSRRLPSRIGNWC